MEKRKRESAVILPDDIVTITVMNHIVDVMHMEKRNTQQTIQKINKDYYVVKKTGELREYQHNENRVSDYKSLKKSFEKIMELARNNFMGNKNELFLTFTYAENMTDPKRLYKDMDKFIKKLKYKFKDKTTIDYLSVVEPQERGAWHVHMLIKFNELKTAFIPHGQLLKMWGHGLVWIERIHGVDDLGAYLVSYLTDVELTDETYLKGLEENRELVEKKKDGETKKIIKGGRLYMYPTGMNLYRKSRGIVFPKKITTTYKNIKKIVGSAKPHYSTKYEIQKDDFENTFQKEQYNLKRL